MTISPKFARSRDGHPVQILRTWTEQEIEFAEIRYLDGFMPGPVGGRLAGTEDEPTWEHRVLDGKVIRSGGDYWNDADWIVERGLVFPDEMRELQAEFIVLATFDQLREGAGHDYGAGQRVAELRRRRLHLREHGFHAELQVDDFMPAELHAAFFRVGVPRLRRIEREDYRHHTPATRRTLDTWRRIERRFQPTEVVAIAGLSRSSTVGIGARS